MERHVRGAAQDNRINEKEFGVRAIRTTLRGGRDLFARSPRAALALGYFRSSLRDEVPDSFDQASKEKLIWPRKPFMRFVLGRRGLTGGKYLRK